MHAQMQPQVIQKNGQQLVYHNPRVGLDDQNLMVSNIKNIYKDIKREKNSAVQA